jgi:hypothetical protein
MDCPESEKASDASNEGVEAEPREAHWDADPERGVYLPPRAGGVSLSVPVLVIGTVVGLVAGVWKVSCGLGHESGLDAANIWALLAVGAAKGILPGFVVGAALGLIVGSVAARFDARRPQGTKRASRNKE